MARNRVYRLYIPVEPFTETAWNRYQRWEMEHKIPFGMERFSYALKKWFR